MHVRKLEPGFSATISVPGSKYIANRVLLCAALAEGVSYISNVPDNDDINAVIAALNAIGIDAQRKGQRVRIQGGLAHVPAVDRTIDVGLSGTLFRFITAIAAVIPGTTTITGASRIKQRPIAPLCDALKSLGAHIETTNGYAPLRVTGTQLNGGSVSVDASQSSQFLSALLLVSPLCANSVTLSIQGSLASADYIAMTTSAMDQFGVATSVSSQSYTIEPQPYAAIKYTIPADWSSANYFFAAAAALRGTVTVNNLDSSRNGEAQFIDILKSMGCQVQTAGRTITIAGPDQLKGVSVDMSRCPDAVQTLATIAPFASDTVSITNIAHLKHKESDRIRDTILELEKCDVSCSHSDDAITINPSQPRGSSIDPHEDHRMAMSFAILGLATGDMHIQDDAVVGKSFPSFWQKLTNLYPQNDTGNIVLIGYRGCGKSSIAGLLLRRLGLPVISTDELVKKRTGDIATFVEKHGWAEFRSIEREVLHGIRAKNTIIDCGGGVVEDAGNRAYLKKLGTVFYLKTETEILKMRLQSGDRPALTKHLSAADEVSLVMDTREQLYQSTADHVVDTSEEREFLHVSQHIATTCHGNRARLVVPVTGSTVEEMKSLIHQAEDRADIIELRVDALETCSDDELSELITHSQLPVMVTIRSKHHGGIHEYDAARKKQLFLCAIEQQVDWIDVEHDFEYAEDVAERRGNTGLLISHHDFSHTTKDEIEQVLETITELQPDHTKICTMATSILDCFTALDMQHVTDNATFFCMGLHGHLSRVVSPIFGGTFVYAAIDNDHTVAPGQITLDDFLTVYNLRLLRADTKLLGVIGAHAENSQSKYMHNRMCAKDRLPFIYVPLKVDPNELAAFMERFRAYPFAGAAVTVPHKVAILDYVDAKDPAAAAIGASNTLFYEKDVLTATNTDYIGALSALKEQTLLERKNVLILGAGGAARALCFALTDAGAVVTVMNRNQERAAALAQEFGVATLGLDQKAQAKSYDIVIQATDVGMEPQTEQSLFEKTDFSETQLVMDIIYKPIHTRFIQNARDAGCRVITGDRMLLFQAVGQFEHWTKADADITSMGAALAEQVRT